MQSLDTVFDVLVVQGPADSCEVVGDGRDPTVAARFLPDQLLLARCVQRQMPMVDVFRSSSTVVYVLVIMRVGGSAPDSGHREFGGHSSSQQRQVLDFQQWSYGGDDGFLDAFCVIFRAPPVDRS